MPHFRTRPVEAEQYTGPASIAAVAELVRRYRPHASYESATALGTLRFYNSGDELNLNMHDWVAVIGGEVVVVPPAMFEGSIVEGPE